MEEAFENAAYGMFHIIAPEAEAALRESRDVAVRASDLELLLVNWLSELLYIFEVDAFLPGRFRVTEVKVEDLKGNAELYGSAIGEEIDPARHQLERGIKAVTYHILRVDRMKVAEAGTEGRDMGWRVQVVFDL